MKDIDWQDLKLFLAVARAGGLGPAARLVDASAPTLGRRVTALEQALGQRLFTRRQQGYELTEAGRSLLVHAQEVEAATAAIERWRAGTTTRPSVRISAGHWMTSFLADNIAAIWTTADAWSLDFVTANARLDIGRRAADIGIRNRRPEEGWLAGRKVAVTAFAAFCRRGGKAEETLPWIALAGDAAITPSAQWVARHHGEQVAIKVSDPRSLFDLVRSGAGQAVMPCLAGDREPAFERAGPLIGELTAEQWLVTHHEDRHHPAIHATVERIARLIGAHQGLFAGHETKTGAP
ncbi:LysR family transcriptional regulator [Kaistia dalseonensis]|uniref:DNA-binding transcriptional LysR family regulator n=1 Tax=Kaistia dalseonensis TaxID=410840 RepID=A0ABU0H3B1_9HYPH|nr:LysR family transcriptional regulator [Kaistia dalseonensis]MCX5494211.1 LysR family transcriptional regulator [Kaistia dalseonensis]MDQ0436790.1 DNA-binding transcriptional LysR family regulator [Kaistia dalseonensis]